jgi:epoxyqueuosine reductase
VPSPEIELQAGELEDLILEEGFSKAALVRSDELPQTVSLHPEIATLGQGTFLMTALSCYREETEDLSQPGDPHVLIAPFARRNYYAEAVVRVKRVIRALCKNHGFSKQTLRIFCNSSLPEKALAATSGLGSYGKNTLILIPKLGSLFVIAGLFIPAPVVGISSESAENSRFPLCHTCRACQDACPVDALDEAGCLDESRCLQALCTKPSQLSEAARQRWAFRLYGCQSCQDVCPHNRDLATGAATRRGELGPSLSLKHLLALSLEQLKEYIRGSALDRSWIPPRTLLRNALLAAGNRRDTAVLEIVNRHCSNPDPLVVQAATWAVSRIGDADGGGPA